MTVSTGVIWIAGRVKWFRTTKFAVTLLLFTKMYTSAFQVGIHPCVTTDFKIKYMQMLCLPGGSGCVRSMSSQELAIYWRIGYCKSLPATQLSPDPAQAPQCPPSERWLRTAFFGQPPLCWVHQARPLNREPGPLPCGSFFLFRQQMC